MASTFSWLSYDDSERQSTLEVVESLKMPGTVDELGFARIRDTFRDLLFPGSSVLQTRARYFTFVPRLAAIAATTGPADQASRRFRQLEVDLITALLAAEEDNEGIIGRDARSTLKRFPSAMYWAALVRFGIITVDRGAEHILRTAAATRSAPPVGEGPGSPTGAYGIDPEAAAGWLAGDWKSTGVTFDLEPDEAEYLREHIMSTTQGSLYSWFLRERIAPGEVDYAWEHEARPTYPARMQRVLDHGERFHHLAHGATLAYNLFVSQAAGRPDLVDGDGDDGGYEHDLWQWQQEMATRSMFTGWDLDEFFSMLRAENRNLQPATVTFVRSWRDLGSHLASPGSRNQMEQLIKARELQTKRNRARLHNPKARDGWEGDVGIMKLAYNWPVMQRIVTDIQGAAHASA